MRHAILQRTQSDGLGTLAANQEAVCTKYDCEVKAAACDSWAPRSSRASSYQPLSPLRSLQSNKITLICWLLLLGAANAISTSCLCSLRSAGLTIVVSQLAGPGYEFSAEECHPIPECAAALCEHRLDGQVAAAGVVDEAGHIACRKSSLTKCLSDACAWLQKGEGGRGQDVLWAVSQ